MGGFALAGLAVGLAAVARTRGIGGAADLISLHAVEEAEELGGHRVAVEAGALEGEEQFVGRLQRRKAALLRLLFDHVAAAAGGREHDAREALEARAEAQHFARAAPRGIEQEHDQAAIAEVGGRQVAGGQIAGLAPGVEEHREVARVVDQRLHRRVVVETDAHVNHAFGEAQVGEPARVGPLFLKLFRMHQKHEPGAGGHRGNRRAPAQGLGPETPVTHVPAHGAGGRRRGADLTA